ncbi:MAG TPA: hypothetical protein VFQ65_10085 [Kofleriaceae bacterium]|nr:hypothetical protein [Kofleriaceae bacterium]
MKGCAVVVPALLLACGSDPTLAVSVSHPSTVTVAKTEITVYESDSLKCTDLEFARVDPAGLEALAADDVMLEGTASGGLSGISRTGHKVIVARGFDANMALVAIGCAQKDEVIGADSVQISTFVAAAVSIHPPSDPSMLDVAITLTDARGASLPDMRPVTWTVYGPAGSTAANPANITAISDGVWEPALPSCTGNGVTKLRPNPPKVLGGYAVQIRAAWALEEPQPYSSLAATAFANTDLHLTPSTTARRFCTIRQHGPVHRLVCVDSSNVAHDLAIAIDATAKAIATDMGTQSALPALAGAQNVIAVVAEPATGTDRDVYAVTDRGALVPLFGAPDVTDQALVCPLCSEAIVVPPCGATPGKVLLAGPSKTIRQIDLHGGNLQSFDVPGVTAVRLDNAGCVTQLQAAGSPTLAQLASLHAGGLVATTFVPAATLIASCTGGGACKVLDQPLVRGAGVGFTADTEPRIVVANVDATGVVLTQLVIAPTSGPAGSIGTTIERSRTAAASIPDRLVVGQVDTDTGTDLFWDIATRNSGTSFQIAYARKVGDVNLEALSTAQDIDVDDLVTGDLDGNGLDDVVVLSTTGAAIVPMGVTLPAPPPNTDATCMP